VLTTNETFPIVDYKLLKDIVKEPEFPAGKDTKQMPIEISKDLAEVECGRIRGLRDHPAQHFAQRPGPVSEQSDCTSADLGRSGEIRSAKVALFPA
jgi:hypothetical protein